MQREISHICIHMYEMYGWAQKHKHKIVSFVTVSLNLRKKREGCGDSLKDS